MKRVAPAIVALAAVALAIAYAYVTARLGGRIALPVDEAYRSLACAAHRDVSCAGSPSLSWPALLAIFGSITRGHALVIVAFSISAALYALTVAGTFVVARRIGGTLAGVLAAIATLAIAPFAYAALSGLEVALTAACWVGALALLDRQRDTPGIVLGAAVVVLGLTRQDALIVIVSIALAGVWGTTTWRGVAAWLVLLVPALGWRVIAHPRGEPMFELEALRGDGAPLAYAFAVLWLIGVLRMWSRPGAIVIAASPIAYLVVGGLAPAFPVFAIAVGCAAASGGWVPRIGGIVAALALVGLAILPLRAGLQQYAQDAADLDRRVAVLVPRLRELTAIGAHDPGIVALYTDARVIALDGDSLEGPGARFERLERLPPELRPTHFVTSPLALGFDALLGEPLAYAGLAPKLAPHRRWTRGELQLVEARWDHVLTAERPLTPRPNWHVVDRVDVADLDDERAHGWSAQTSGTQATLFHRDPGALLLDGGRTITGSERFTLEVDPARPVRLVLRTGGHRKYPDHEALSAGAALRIHGQPLAIPWPWPHGTLVEVELALAAGASREILVETDRPYRVFHWFALQPD